MHNKYAGLIPLIDKKSITITTTFQKIWGNFGLKQNKIRIDQDNKVMTMALKCIQHTTKGNLLLLIDLSGPSRLQSSTIRRQYQRCVHQ